VNQWLNPLKSGTGSNLVDLGRAAAHAERVDSEATPTVGCETGEEATVKACGVTVARLQGKSWAPIPLIGCVVNVGTIPGSSVPLPSQGGGGQARRQLVAPGWGGGSVVVRGGESSSHGEGTQRVRSKDTGRPGGRW
jgi:hypothetical protein